MVARREGLGEMSEASVAVNAATVAMRRAVAKTMSKEWLADRKSGKQRDKDNKKVLDFCKGLEKLGQQRTRRCDGVAKILKNVRAKKGFPNGRMLLHRSKERLVHNDFLPSLQFNVAEDGAVTDVDKEYDGEKWRSLAPPLWQEAEEGAMNPPHIDYDRQGGTMTTRIGLREPGG